MLKLSVIIPTHNRAKTLLQALEALAAQTFSKSEFEVIVVADGCTDNTVEMVRSYQAPYRLQIFEQDGRGAAAARNSGAAIANGAILLFLDDDVTASPLLVETHVKAHQLAANRVVIGYLPPIMKGRNGFFRKKLEEWWWEVYQHMQLRADRLSYRDLLSGNFSVSTQLFHLVGGFNTSFKCQEDYELGVRLVQADAQLSFARDALGYHNEIADLKRWLYRKYSEGKVAVQFCREYPQLIETLPVFNQFKNEFPPFYKNKLQFIYKWKTLAYCKAVIYRYTLHLLELLRKYKLWEKLLGRLQAYWYLKGALDAAGDPDTLISFLKEISNKQQKSDSVAKQ